MVKKLDPLSVGYAIVGLAALTISSAATFAFFDYLLDTNAAYAATIVLAAGLPLLKFASYLDPKNKRTYTRWLYGVLAIELVAQYFKAQASFAPTVAATAALAQTDLASAAQNVIASRVLAFLFLASMPFAVLAMCQALAQRIVARNWRTFLRRLAPVRARIRRLARERASAVAERDRHAAALKQTIAERDAMSAKQHALVAERESQLAQAERFIADLREQLQHERARPVVDVRTAMRVLIDAGAPEATIRSWQERGRLIVDSTAEQVQR